MKYGCQRDLFLTKTDGFGSTLTLNSRRINESYLVNCLHVSEYDLQYYR